MLAKREFYAYIWKISQATSIVLRNSSQTYHIYLKESINTESEIRSSITFNTETQNIDIKLGKADHYGLMAHELKHAYQFEIGEMSFGYKKKWRTFSR